MAPAVKFRGLTALGRDIAVVVGILALASSGTAQSRPGFTPGFSHFSVRRVPMARTRRPFYPGYLYYGAPFYSDYEPYGEYEPEPPPPAPVAPAKIEPLPDPLLLELHGNQWVRVTSFTQSSGGDGQPRGPSAEAARAKPLPPAILVFRDGHTEELTSYSIIGQKIYTKAANWTTGVWTRSIQIADLNIPATLKKNEERGVNFELPSGPDEVMIRP
jgi:hypothetical protein